MASYSAEVSWSRGEQKFVDNRYSRKHSMKFDGGTEVPGSSSPHVVPLPYSDATAVDPEEAFVASISSCHMLFFLSIAAARKFRVDRYRDNAIGVMGKNASGKMVISTVTLKPETTFSGVRVACHLYPAGSDGVPVTVPPAEALGEMPAAAAG